MMSFSARRTRGESGSLAPSVAAIIVILFLLGGLIIDGARALGARSRATAYAEEGARIAGQGVNFDRGRLDLDVAAIRANAEDYCARISATDDGVEGCDVNRQGGDIVFTVDLTIDKGILGMVSSDPTMSFTGEGRAVAEIGIVEAQGSADDPPEVEGRQVPVDDVPVNITAAPGGQCPPTKLWTASPFSVEEPFRYWDKLRDTMRRNDACEQPPVCPNSWQPVRVSETYSPRPRQTEPPEIPRSALEEDEERWEPARFASCPTVEELLFSYTPEPEESDEPGPGDGDPTDGDPTDGETEGGS